MKKSITNSALPASNADSIVTKRPGRVLKVSTEEAKGIRDILANPAPPTPELKAAWSDYLCHAADDPDSNW